MTPDRDALSPDAAEWAAQVAARRAGRAHPPAGDLFDNPQAGILPGLPLFTEKREG